MPVRRPRTFTRRMRSGRLRHFVWATQFSSNVLLASGGLSSAIDLTTGLETVGSSVLGATVMRTHLRLHCVQPSTDTAPAVIYGLIVWDSTIAKPDPGVDFYADWYWNSFLSPATSNSAISGVPGTNTSYGETIDVRARRRLHQMNDHPFFLMHNFGSTSVTFDLFCRTLLALP